MHESISALKGIPTKEVLLDLLSKELVEITFDKLNGDERIMSCTLQESYLPPTSKEDSFSQKKIRNLEEKTLVVWDINAQAWRSFRYDRVKKVTQIS